MPPIIHVLYAEDSPSDLDLTRQHFELHAPDLQLDIVTTGQACLAHLDHRRYDALLLDNHLPDRDSVDVLKALRRSRTTVPVIVITAVGDEALVVRVLRLGAWDYLPKHGDYIESLPAILRRTVADYRARGMQQYAARRQLRRVLYIERHPADVDLTIERFAADAPNIVFETAGSAGEGLRRLESNRFDLVLTDLRMPDMNALDLLRTLRQRNARVPTWRTISTTC